MYKSLAIVSILAASISAAPVQSTHAKRQVAYVQYNGDGSAADGWPTVDQWQSWDQLWSINSPLMAQSCGWNGWGTDNSAQETSDVGSAIQSVAGQNGLDERFVLAIVMQESKGCVRVPTTNNGIANPGLMQSHDGSGTCAGVDPCPTSEVSISFCVCNHSWLNYLLGRFRRSTKWSQTALQELPPVTDSFRQLLLRAKAERKECTLALGSITLARSICRIWASLLAPRLRTLVMLLIVSWAGLVRRGFFLGWKKRSMDSFVYTVSFRLSRLVDMY